MLSNKKECILYKKPYFVDEPLMETELLNSAPIVLVIDDDETIIHLITALVEELSYNVLTASNGIAAMDLLKTHHVDLVITDIIMPGMEGLEVVRNVKRIHPDVPMIAMSGYRASGHLDYLKHAKEFGVNETFQKPFDVETFLQTVQDLVEPKD